MDFGDKRWTGNREKAEGVHILTRGGHVGPASSDHIPPTPNRQ